MIPVISSNVESYSYDSDTGELYVQFHSGGLYLYQGVSDDIADYFNFPHPWSQVGSYLISLGGIQIG